VKIGDLVKFREGTELGVEWKVGVVVNTWVVSYKSRVQSVDIMSEDRIIPRLASGVEVISANILK